MRAKEFFEMIERANEFQVFVGELKREVSVIVDDEILGVATSYEQFEKVLDENFNDVSAILNAEVNKTVSRKEFKIDYIFDNEKFSVKLFVC